MSIILKNACFINWKNLEFSNTNIKVNEGPDETLKFFNDFDEINISHNDEIIDCKGKFVTKSFAVGHHHAYSALSRGMPAPRKTPANFLEILKYIWWNLDKALDKDIIEASALATAIACAKAGSTFIIDHHASPNHIKGSLEIIANAFEKVGLQHLLCYEISDRDGLRKSQQALEETERYLQNNQGLVGLHAAFTVGIETLLKSVDLMEKYNTGIHIHVAEDKYDQEYSKKHYNKTVVKRLHEFGVLNSSKTILAHCLHINKEERNLIANSPAFVVQNSESNLNNGVGHFNSSRLGNNIFIGTDGMHSDMIRSLQLSYFTGKEYDNTDLKKAYNRLRMVHNYLKLNSFKGDGENNLIILNYDSPTEMHQNNFLGHLFFGINSNHIETVISNGKIISRNNSLQNTNEEDVTSFLKEQANRLWAKL
jgi:cytosine/adenosine deaminase-related metal-dependent hydrolase